MLVDVLPGSYCQSYWIPTVPPGHHVFAERATTRIILYDSLEMQGTAEVVTALWYRSIAFLCDILERRHVRCM